MGGIINKGCAYIRIHGLRYTIRRSWDKFSERVLGTYDRQWRSMRMSDEELAYQRAHQPGGPLISVVIPVYNTQPRLLSELLESLLAQTYQQWEACLYDASTHRETSEVLQRYAAQDPRLRVQQAASNEGISGNTNQAMRMARGTWIALCDHDDLLSPDALWRVAQTIDNEEPDLVYTDEDKITENSRMHTDPHCKPDFSPDLLCSSNYVCHLAVIRKALLDKVGGLRSAFDGSQDHDLMLRCAEHTQRIAHVPQICYHWRSVGTSMSHQHLEKCLEASRKASEEHIKRMGYPGSVTIENSVLRLRYDVPDSLKVAIMILGEDQQACQTCADRMKKLDQNHVSTVITAVCSKHERWECINKMAEASTADVLLILDASVVASNDGFVTELLMYAQRSDVGAVTPVLMNRRGQITHAGYVIDQDGNCFCRSEHLRQTAGGIRLMTIQSHNVSAVSPACFAIRRAHFQPIHGAGVDLPSELAAWCLMLQTQGKRHVFTPHAKGYCVSAEVLKPARSIDMEALRCEHVIGEDWHDSCWNPWLDPQKANYRMGSTVRTRRR